MKMSYGKGCWLRGLYLPLLAEYANVYDWLDREEYLLQSDTPLPEYTGEEAVVSLANSKKLIVLKQNQVNKDARHRVLKLIHRMSEGYFDRDCYPDFSEVEATWPVEVSKYKQRKRLLTSIAIDNLKKISRALDKSSKEG